MRTRRIPGAVGLLFFSVSVTGTPVLAGDQSGPAVPAPPPPYSLPFQLRPASIGNVLRLDTSLAAWRNGAGDDGTTWVSGLIGTRKVANRFGLLGRVSLIHNSPPTRGSEKSATVVSNPLIGATFLRSRPGGHREGLFAAATLPIGGGGGDTPRLENTQALSRGIASRSGMDNALFAVNYFTLVGGGTIARVTKAATIQAEATVLQLFRARGAKTQDARRTNFTAGIHAGHSFRPSLSAGAELRYQRWLSDAAPVRTNPKARETVTFAFGPRFHFKLSGSKWIRPGISFTLPLDEPLSGQRYRILQFDVPVSF